MPGDVARYGKGILVGGGEGVLGGESVVDADDDRLDVAAQSAADAVMGVQVPRDEAAAVEEDHRRGDSALSGTVDADRDPGHGVIGDGADREWRVGRGRERQLAQTFAGLRERGGHGGRRTAHPNFSIKATMAGSTDMATRPFLGVKG